MPGAPPSTVVVETGPDWLGFTSSILAGLVGVAGGLLVYWLGQRASASTEREEWSIRAAGDLLTALALYAHVPPEPRCSRESLPVASFVFGDKRLSGGQARLRLRAARSS